MTNAPTRGRGPSEMGAELVNPDLLLDPLDYLAAEHYRQRAVMKQLDWLVQMKRTRTWARLAQSTLAFLRVDLPRHAADEQDLLTLLRRRCALEEFDAVSDMLRSKHAADRALGTEIAAAIDALKGDRAYQLGPDFIDLVKSFAAVNRRCLAWEDANVLPLARRCLRKSDLDRLADSMSARRGIAIRRPAGSIEPVR